MAMDKKGLTKLVEECGELIQACAKKMAYMEGSHPDGTDIDSRIEEEMADVLSAIGFVVDSLALDTSVIQSRLDRKAKLFREWDKLP